MLELWTRDDWGDDPFATIEAYLRQRGFFDPDARGDDRCADLYLGYGLSSRFRREPWPDPPEPCRLPLAACRVRTAPARGAADAIGGGTDAIGGGTDAIGGGTASARSATDAMGGLAASARGAADPIGGGTASPSVALTATRPAAPPDAVEIGAWQPTWDEAAYRSAVQEVRAAIGRGDVYQVNLVQHLSARFHGDPFAVARALAPLEPLHPAPFVGDGWAIVSASPELFLAREGDRAWTMPIKGTLPLGSLEPLTRSAKDTAEHVMIVDLERNDLGRVCATGTVRWPQLMVERRMAGVRHLVSTVEGTLRDGTGLADLLRALFPGGSVTGAPKIAALDQIARLEPVGRGASMGALGTVWPNGDLRLALTIRTFAIADGRIHLWVGGGITWDSDPGAEVEESWVKARPLLRALEAARPAALAGVTG